MKQTASTVKLDTKKLPLVLEYLFQGTKKEYVLKYSKSGGLCLIKKEY